MKWSKGNEWKTRRNWNVCANESSCCDTRHYPHFVWMTRLYRAEKRLQNGKFMMILNHSESWTVHRNWYRSPKLSWRWNCIMTGIQLFVVFSIYISFSLDVYYSSIVLFAFKIGIHKWLYHCGTICSYIICVSGTTVINSFLFFASVLANFTVCEK